MRAVLDGELDDAIGVYIEVGRLAALVDDRSAEWWASSMLEFAVQVDIRIYWRGGTVGQWIRETALQAAMLADFAAGLESCELIGTREGRDQNAPGAPPGGLGVLSGAPRAVP